MKYVHPFPARMVPELVLEKVEQLPKNSLVLDPMAGSGTVLGAAAHAGVDAIGFDMDPLAVMMSRVATTEICVKKLSLLATHVQETAQELDSSQTDLPWMDNCDETSRFVDYWFAEKQKSELRRIGHVLHHDNAVAAEPDIKQVLNLAMSRLIITKESKASLARDTSRSRPHKVKDDNDFDVIHNFGVTAKRLKNLLMQQEIVGRVKVEEKDARCLDGLADDSVDIIITSPPYLNAIDYMRGHRMSLVWMGYSIPSLRKIRTRSVGADNGFIGGKEHDSNIDNIFSKQVKLKTLPSATQKMVKHYIYDVILLLAESHRILKPSKRAVYVVADSFLRGVEVKNSNIIADAAQLAGFVKIGDEKRTIAFNKRSLPFLNSNSQNSLNKRMKYERVLTFVKTG